MWRDGPAPMLLRMCVTNALALDGKEFYSCRVPSNPNRRSRYVTETQFDHCFMGAPSFTTGPGRCFCGARRAESVRVFWRPGLKTVHVVFRAIYFHATARCVDGSCRFGGTNRRRFGLAWLADAPRSISHNLRDADGNLWRAAPQRIFCARRNGAGNFLSRHRAGAAHYWRWTVVG